MQFPHGKGPSSSVVGRPPPPRPGLHGVRVCVPSSAALLTPNPLGQGLIALACGQPPQEP